ncbi:hypothetical protein LV85_04326 [Algoriphagus chordae]|uniref:Uncharacterized protein n=1 Tax=Algoriphagus chordae TaxID=237019 RepID=A0A2W7QK62_9BACT|nr:hypothetical protein LV85_04326 [Algoriphagus chordae]
MSDFQLLAIIEIADSWKHTNNFFDEIDLRLFLVIIILSPMV